eukprot:6344085-Prorocentrum_lima.AAC.1
MKDLEKKGLIEDLDEEEYEGPQSPGSSDTTSPSSPGSSRGTRSARHWPLTSQLKEAAQASIE